ncbi:right-handed parallel beta-helix repeat-containing protein [Asanoa siamensis]|uniref:Right handed beta helix domain-containing protein n=1 Tax=Asanoa siamensis TaxID=926357 RepID=A0ABQ4D3J7_9ACTN|nr:right-handed parallel beta-helix repeat-containing protein [Asanoa siamensis]GIF77858.1 hypothetical protein Asi02nite_73760 [Asanoa siamensis]
MVDIRSTPDSGGGRAGVPSRRALLRGSGLAAAGLAGVATTTMLDPTAAHAAPVGPWEYVAPGASIQSAISSGAKAIQLGAGRYTITTPIAPTPGCTIRGVGQRTEILAGAAMASMIEIGGGNPVDGVYIGDLVLDCASKATNGIDLNIVGTTGNYKGEPDSMCRLDNLWVYNPVLDGIVYRGSDTQATSTSRVRVRGAGQYGFHVNAPDNWWTACEATTRASTGANAGFYIGANAANNFFQACKAWYVRGYGWHVRSTRNKFVGCEAQDTKAHGWYVEWDRNTFVGCVADTAGMYDVSGTPNTADGFYLAPGLETALVGCQAFDRRPGGHAAQQRYGFNVPAGMVSSGRLAAPTGWDNTSGLINQR